jgi:hypothetical protein
MYKPRFRAAYILFIGTIPLGLGNYGMAIGALMICNAVFNLFFFEDAGDRGTKESTGTPTAGGAGGEELKRGSLSPPASGPPVSAAMLDGELETRAGAIELRVEVEDEAMQEGTWVGDGDGQGQQDGAEHRHVRHAPQRCVAESAARQEEPKKKLPPKRKVPFSEGSPVIIQQLGRATATTAATAAAASDSQIDQNPFDADAIGEKQSAAQGTSPATAAAAAPPSAEAAAAATAPDAVPAGDESSAAAAENQISCVAEFVDGNEVIAMAAAPVAAGSLDASLGDHAKSPTRSSPTVTADPAAQPAAETTNMNMSAATGPATPVAPANDNEPQAADAN